MFLKRIRSIPMLLLMSVLLVISGCGGDGSGEAVPESKVTIKGSGSNS